MQIMTVLAQSVLLEPFFMNLYKKIIWLVGWLGDVKCIIRIYLHAKNQCNTIRRYRVTAKKGFAGRTDGRTNGWTDRRTDGHSPF